MARGAGRGIDALARATAEGGAPGGRAPRRKATPRRARATAEGRARRHAAEASSGRVEPRCAPVEKGGDALTGVVGRGQNGELITQVAELFVQRQTLGLEKGRPAEAQRGWALCGYLPGKLVHPRV